MPFSVVSPVVYPIRTEAHSYSAIKRKIREKMSTKEYTIRVNV